MKKRLVADAKRTHGARYVTAYRPSAGRRAQLWRDALFRTGHRR